MIQSITAWFCTVCISVLRTDNKIFFFFFATLSQDLICKFLGVTSPLRKIACSKTGEARCVLEDQSQPITYFCKELCT